MRITSAMPTLEYLSGKMSELAIMHELAARPVSSLIASEQMNLAGVREWTCRRKSDHWQAGHGALAQAISLMSNTLGFDALWHTACWRTTQCYRSLRTMSLGGGYGRTASGYTLCREATAQESRIHDCGDGDTGCCHLRQQYDFQLDQRNHAASDSWSAEHR